MGQPARMRRPHSVDIPRFSRIRHRCDDSPESGNLAKTCPDARYSEKSLNISRQKGESESFSESNLNISPNRRGAAVAGVPGCLHLHSQCENASGRAPVSPRNEGKQAPGRHIARITRIARAQALRDVAATRASTKRAARNRTDVYNPPPPSSHTHLRRASRPRRHFTFLMRMIR